LGGTRILRTTRNNGRGTPQYTAVMNVVNPPPSATVTPIGTGRHWIARLPPGLFAIVFGLLGLAGAWRRLAGLDVAHAETVSALLLHLATGVLIVLGVLQVVKELRHKDDARRDRAHPVHGAMLSLVSLTVLLSVALWLPLYPEHREMAISVTVAALVSQMFVAWLVMPRVATGDIPADMVTPALYLPLVGGGLIGAMALSAIAANGAAGAHAWAVLLFGVGVGSWALLEVRVMNRLFAGPLPPPLRATLGIEIAPAPVAVLSALSLWPALPADVIVVGLGIACVPLLAVLARWRWWTSVPFSAGFWSFSFPIAAFASVIVEATRRSGWPMEVAYGAVLMATALIAYLAARTLALLFRGRLLPPG
jgi:tellurite resistance protein